MPVSKNSSSSLPGGADFHSLGHWRARPSSPGQSYRSFVEAAIAADKEAGRAGSPIAPTYRSEISESQRRRLRRHSRVWWILSVIFLLLLIDTVISTVLVVQDLIHHVAPTPAHIIWFLVSLAFIILSGAATATLYLHRRSARREEKGLALQESKKWERHNEESQNQKTRISMQAERLRDSLRSVSREKSRQRSERSVSRGRTGKSKEKAEKMTTTAFDSQGWGTIDGVGAQQPREMTTIEKPLPALPPRPPRTSSLPQGATMAFELQPAYTLPESLQTPSFQPSERSPNPSAAQSSPYRTTPLDQYTRAETLRQGFESKTSLPWTHHLDLNPDEADGAIAKADAVSPQHQSSDTEGTANDEVEVGRAGHGELGPIQSDANFRATNELEEDAISDDERLKQMRRARSKERVLPWTEKLESVE
ncbi:hypothetical protein MMC06_002896 [Schaereria dolodes]|nr:hypothetical protein [Schaereria dolodes]